MRARVPPPSTPTRRAETSRGSERGGVGGGAQRIELCTASDVGESFPPCHHSPNDGGAGPLARQILSTGVSGCTCLEPRGPRPVPSLRAGPKNRGESAQPPPSPPPHPSQLFLQLLLETPGVERCLKSRSVPGTHHGCPQRVTFTSPTARTEPAHLCPCSIGAQRVPGPGGLRLGDPRGSMPSTRPRSGRAARLRARLVAGLVVAQPSPAWPRQGLWEPESPAGRGRASAGWGRRRLLPASPSRLPPPPKEGSEA